MSNEPDLSDVKKLLRSLLISSKTGLSIDQLCRDFRVQEGYPLPYAKFGYPNPSTFLRECQDIAESSFRRGVHFLRGVADDNTRHIQKLVDAQKKTKAKPTRNNCASNTNTNSRYSSNHNIAPRFAKRRSPSNSNFQSDNQFDDTSSYSYKFNAESPYPGPSKNHSSEHIDLPNNIKDRLINFLNSYTTGIRIDNFSTAYRNRYGQYLDHRQYGFDSLEQLCKTLPNAEFLSGGRTAVIRSIGKDGIIAESDYSSGNGSFFEEDNSKQLTPFKAKSECDTNFITDAGDPNLNPKVRNNFIQILNRHPNGIHVSNFCEEYELLTKTPLDLNGHGYVSVMEMASANQDIFDFYRSGSDDWILMKKGNKDLASTNEDRLKKIAKNIHTILSDFKDGYPLNDFTVLYEKKLNESLTSCMENYDSVEKFLSEKFSHLVKLIEVESRTNVILKSNIHTSFSSPLREIKAIYPPSDVVDRDGRIERATLPKMEDINDGYLEINIAEVVSPSKFWFFCNDKDGSCRLDTLMNELQDVYNSDKSRTYLLLDSAVEIGHICVAPYPQDNDWYRCKITAIRDSMQVEVFYFDFGTVGLVERSTLHYLRKCFLELPAQGILGKLGYVMPINQQKIWEDKANHFFYQLATHKPVLAKVLDFNTSIVPLLMYDTNTSVDIFINDELVNNGLARYSQDPHGTTPRNLMQNSLLPSVLSNNMMSVNNMNSMAFPDPLTTAALTLQLLNQPVLQNLSQTYELMKQGTENSLAKSQDLHSEFSHHFEKVPSTMHVISPSRNPNSGLVNSSLDHGSLLECNANVDTNLSNENSRSSSRVLRECKNLGPKKRLVQRVSLRDNITVHLIKHDDQPFMTSGEISNFFWKKDNLRKMLVALNFRCPCMTIDQQDHPKLFQVMALYGIRGIRESSTGLIKEIIFIYPLKHVPDIIHALSHKSPYLEEDLIELYKNFDGNSPYWKGEVSSEIDEDSVNKDPALVEIENLRSSLIMEKREHLMHMLEDVNVKGSVKLKQIEDQIDTVDSIIEQMKSKMKNLAEDTMNRSTPDGASEEKKLSTSCYINSDLDVNSTEFSSSNFKI